MNTQQKRIAIQSEKAMTPTDLETLRGLVKRGPMKSSFATSAKDRPYKVMEASPKSEAYNHASQYFGELIVSHHATDSESISKDGSIRYIYITGPRIIDEKEIKVLTALLADYERMREGLDSAIQQLAELAQPLTPALNGSYAKGEQIGYENAVRILTALRATLKGEKHD